MKGALSRFWSRSRARTHTETTASYKCASEASGDKRVGTSEWGQASEPRIPDPANSRASCSFTHTSLALLQSVTSTLAHSRFARRYDPTHPYWTDLMTVIYSTGFAFVPLPVIMMMYPPQKKGGLRVKQGSGATESPQTSTSRGRAPAPGPGMCRWTKRRAATRLRPRRKVSQGGIWPIHSGKNEEEVVSGI